MATDSPPQEGLVITMVLKTEPDIEPFFLNFWFNPSFLPFLGGVLPDWTGFRFPIEPVGPAGPVFKKVVIT